MSATSRIPQVARRLFRAPTFTIVSALTLAIGIGAATAMYAVVDGVLLEPLPYPDADRLVGVWHEAPGLDLERVEQSYATYLTYRADTRAFEDIAIWQPDRRTVTGEGEPEQVETIRMSDGTLAILGVAPALGREFTLRETRPGAASSVLVSHAYWQTRLGGDPDVIGRTLQVDGVTREILGVLPAGFRFIEREASLFLPFVIDPATVELSDFSYRAIARLRPGVTRAQANADIERLIPVAAERYAGGLSLDMLREARFGPLVQSLRDEVVGDVARVLWVLLGTVGIVLVIACANVANLFLVRGEARYREIAVRTALGASRRRVAADFIAESMLLAALGGLAGFALAAGGLRLLHGVAPDGLPRLHAIGADGSVLLFALAVTAITGLLVGTVPLLRAARPDVAGALREGGRGGSAGRARHRARNALVVAQLALALVLLAASGLMLRSVQALRDVDPGFTEPEQVLTFYLAIPSARIADPLELALTHQRILGALSDLPGVRSAGLASGLPLDQRTSGNPIWVDGEDRPASSLPPIRRYKWITPGYVTTIGNRVIAGRDLSWDDVRNRAGVVLVTENVAREYWGDPQAALGRRIRSEPTSPWREIVGVVGNVREAGIDQEAPGLVYWPQVVQDMWGEGGVFTHNTMGYALRLEQPLSTALMDEVRRTIWDIDATLPLADVRTLDRALERSMARSSFALIILAIAALVALLLGAVGLYGVIAYTVAQRTREFGVRMALGARAVDVGRLVLRNALLLVAGGVAIGLVAAAALTRLMTALLFGVRPIDPVTFAGVAAALAAVALFAAWVPAFRATRVDPLEALRAE